MEYNLKDKLQVTKEFLTDIETKSWQEIEHLQSQIANIAEGEELAQLLKNLLTSYYVFVGGIERISAKPTPTVTKVIPFTDNVCVEKELITAEPIDSNSVKEFNNKEVFADLERARAESQESSVEPFEYFVDFDEPVGEPITDDDLYN
jgi:hypothetical protein